jgi:uncharacterized membrane protein YeiB
MHWPGSAIILLFSILFPLIDIIVQSVRKKPKKEVRIWSAVAVFFLSIFLLFKLLFWPGAMLMSYIMLAFFAVLIIRYLQLKPNFNLRYGVVLILFLFAGIHLFLAPSSVKLLYLTENPFDKNTSIPAYEVHSLAYQFYLENKKEKSRALLLNNIDHYKRIIENKEQYGIQHDIYENNLRVTKESLEKLNKNEWTNHEFVIPIDINLK